MVMRYKPPVVSGDDGAEMMRQFLKKVDQWNCPLLTQDPGFGQMPPGMLWIRTDMVGCERYRFYDENGNVVTLCGDEDTDTTGTQSLDLVKSSVRNTGSPDIVSNTTAETDFVTQYTIPGGTVAVGDLFRVHIHGATRVDAVVSANLRLRLYFAGVVIADTQNQTIVSPNTNAPWFFEVDFVVSEIGSPNGKIHFGGAWNFTTGSASVPTYRHVSFNSGAGDGTTYATLSDAIIKVSADWDTADTDDACELILFSVIKGRVGGL